MRSVGKSVVGLGVLGLVAACAQHATDDPLPTSGAPTGPGLDSTSQGGATSAALADAPLTCTGAQGGASYSKYKTAFFGNLHQHTANSLDAYAFGTRASPADAYLFAKKQTSIQVASGTNDGPGPTVTIDRPLDFLAITDHAEWLGVDVGCNDPNSSMYSTPQCAKVRSGRPIQQALDFVSIRKFYDDLCGTDSATAAECASEQRSAWADEQQAAADAYEPCKFTSLVAYEWTNSIDGDTNHRNVIFGSAVVPTVPLDSIHYPARTDLWSGLDQQCTGSCVAITPPHNSNQSRGVSLTPPASAGEAVAMSKYQRLAEIYQHKGASECYFDPKDPSFSDPDCAFEYVNPGDERDVPASYVRSALKSGLSYASANGGTNPLQLGIMASTDDHNGIAGLVKEDAFVGHTGRNDDTAEKRLASETLQQYGSGGLAVVWAEQNTRDSVFAALTRRESYGTSGPRLLVRFYETSYPTPCTADFPQTMLDTSAATVPMGGTFHADALAGHGPRFAIAAWPDTAIQSLASGREGRAGLAKVQVIKAHGTTTITEDPPVDIPVAEAGQCLTWTDPHFSPAEQAVYYVRVLQVPTWRWSHFDCQGSSADGCQAGGKLDVAIQERAWTSPIWYAP